MARDIAKTIDNVSNYNKNSEELEKEFRRKVQALKDQRSEFVKKLDAARTHIVMSTTPQIMDALGLNELLKSSADEVLADEELKEKLKSEKNFAIVFKEYDIAVQAVIQYLYTNKDVAGLILEYVNKELVRNGKQPRQLPTETK